MLGLVLTGSAAFAGAVETDLHLNAASITIQARNVGNTMNVAFNSATFTGALVFGLDSDSSMSVAIDSTNQANFAGTIIGLNGTVNLTSGQITSGMMSVLVQNPDSSVDQYAYDVVTGSGSVSRPSQPSAFAIQGYSLSGLTSDGIFTDANFGGVDISSWFNQQPVEGSFLQFNYHPNAAGYDNNANVNVTAAAFVSSPLAPVPLPRSAWAGGFLLMGFGAWRKISSWRKSQLA